LAQPQVEGGLDHGFVPSLMRQVAKVGIAGLGDRRPIRHRAVLAKTPILLISELEEPRAKRGVTLVEHALPVGRERSDDFEGRSRRVSGGDGPVHQRNVRIGLQPAPIRLRDSACEQRRIEGGAADQAQDLARCGIESDRSSPLAFEELRGKRLQAVVDPKDELRTRRRGVTPCYPQRPSVDIDFQPLDARLPHQFKLIDSFDPGLTHVFGGSYAQRFQPLDILTARGPYISNHVGVRDCIGHASQRQRLDADSGKVLTGLCDPCRDIDGNPDVKGRGEKRPPKRLVHLRLEALNGHAEHRRHFVEYPGLAPYSRRHSGQDDPRFDSRKQLPVAVEHQSPRRQLADADGSIRLSFGRQFVGPDDLEVPQLQEQGHEHHEHDRKQRPVPPFDFLFARGMDDGHGLGVGAVKRADVAGLGASVEPTAHRFGAIPIGD